MRQKFEAPELKRSAMVQEVRDIILSLDEVAGAFESYRRMTPGFVPAGSVITGCATSGESVVVQYAVDTAPSTQNSLTCSGADVLRPMIRYCIENNIMLPRDGKKSILFEKDCVKMHIELDLHTDLPAALNPMRINHMNGVPPKEAKAIAASA